MPMVAQQIPYTLFVVNDFNPMNPREDCEPFGKMVCWHRRYCLGDNHDHRNPEEFLRRILFDNYSSYPGSKYGKPIYDYIKRGKARDVRLEYDRSTREWELLKNNYWFTGNDWYPASTYSASLKGKDVPDWFLDDCLAALQINELTELVEQMPGMVILPLYLYDHGGITMSCASFSCPWDSGQVGWIYADYEIIKNNFGKVTAKTIEKAENLLEAVVKDYDHYLTGQCYGIKLYEGDTEIDSCWGFNGDISEVSANIKEHLPPECENIVDTLEFYCDINEDEYLEQALKACA